MTFFAESQVTFSGLWVLLGVILAVLVYVIISTEKVHRTIVALLGATLMSFVLIFGSNDLIHLDAILKDVDWSVILFITGMMIIVTISVDSGLFQFIALYFVRLTHGKILQLYILFFCFALFLSPIFGGIATLLILAPLTVEICTILGYNPKPFLLTQAFVANFGVIPGLIGSIPNIIIGKEGNLSFLDFLFVMTPLYLIYGIVGFFYLYWNFKDELNVEAMEIEDIYILDLRDVIVSERMFYLSAFVLVLVLAGFIIGQPILNIEPTLTVLFGASILLLFSGEEPEESFNEVEWSTIFFIIGILIVVEGLSLLGVIKTLADLIGSMLGGNLNLGIIVIVLLSGGLSSIIDNIPIAAALAPLVSDIGLGNALFFALVIGTNIGGMVLVISSPVNILAVSYCEKGGHEVSFLEFFKLGAPLALLFLITGAVYLIGFYWIF